MPVGTPFLVSADPKSSDGKNALPTLGHVIGYYKAVVTRLARQQNLLDDTSGMWQGRYHDHIIRSESSLNMLRAYIQQNPARWQEDKFYEQA